MQTYHDTIQSITGDIITTSTVTVYDSLGATANIFAEDETTALNNPFTVSDSNYDTDGSFWFKADNGAYDIKVVSGGTDGGWFKGVTGTSGLSDNGYISPTEDYCGTVFIPTGGDGSAGWLRIDGGYNVGLGHNVEWYGAIGDDSTDCLAGFDLAKASKKVFVPSGNYNISSILVLDGVYMYGTGETSIISGTVEGDCAISLTGNAPLIKDIYKKHKNVTSKTSTDAGAGINVSAATRATVENCRIDGSSGVGILITNATTDYHIKGNTILNTLADGIHNTHESNKGTITENHVFNSGDDGIAVVSYISKATKVNDINIDNNKVYNANTRGITVVGGDNVKITNNTINNPTYAGILIHSDASFSTYGCLNIKVDNNTLQDTGSSTVENYASIQIAGRASYPVENIKITNNDLLDCRYRGIQAGTGTDTKDIKISGNTIDTNLSGPGIEAIGTQNLNINTNILIDTHGHGIYVANTCTGIIKVLNNDLEDINSSGTASNDVIHIQSASTADAINVSHNSHTNPSAYTVERLVECNNDDAIIRDNYSSVGKLIVHSDQTKDINKNRRSEGTAAPTTGTWGQGDVVYDTTPSASGFMGWVCVTAGSPGTWKTFGAISA